MAEIVPGAPRGTPATKELLPVRDCGDAAEGAAALVRLPTDESPSKFSVASQEWPDADIQSQLCAFATDDGLAEDIEALMDGLPSPGPIWDLTELPRGLPRNKWSCLCVDWLSMKKASSCCGPALPLPVKIPHTEGPRPRASLQSGGATTIGHCCAQS